MCREGGQDRASKQDRERFLPHPTDYERLQKGPTHHLLFTGPKGTHVKSPAGEQGGPTRPIINTLFPNPVVIVWSTYSVEIF